MASTFSAQERIDRILQRMKFLRTRFLIKTGWQEEAILKMELIDLHVALQYYQKLEASREEEKPLQPLAQGDTQSSS